MESISIGESGKSEKRIYDWSSLPPLLLWMTIDKLDAFDNKSFAAVCRDWRSASNSNPKVLQSVGDGFPWITFGYLNKSLEFFSVGGDRKFKVDTPQSDYHRVLSSKRGWILLLKFNGVESPYGSLFLVNFFSGDKIELPPCPANMYSAFFTTNSDGYPQRALILTFTMKILKTARPGDGKWTDHTLSGNRKWTDHITLVGDRFYSLESSLQVITTTNVADRTMKILPRPTRTQPGLGFIVEHEGRLMFVKCVCDDEVNSPYKFRSFDLYTYNHVTSCWIKIRKDEVKDTILCYHKYRGCLAAKGKGLKIYHLLQEVSTAGTSRTWVEVYDLLTGSREIRNLNHQIDGLACWVDIG